MVSFGLNILTPGPQPRPTKQTTFEVRNSKRKSFLNLSLTDSLNMSSQKVQVHRVVDTVCT